jgi:hypothetical protein
MIEIKALQKKLNETFPEAERGGSPEESADAAPSGNMPPASTPADRDAHITAKIWDRLGLKLEKVSAEQLHQFQTQYRGGLSILAVRPHSPAAGQGLRPGDILVGLHVWETTTLEQLNFVLNRPDLADAETWKFFILRDKESKFGYMTDSLRK